MITLVTAVLFSIAALGHAQIKCAHCDHATSISECQQNTITCNSDEICTDIYCEGGECFFEKVTISDLSVAYNAGCRLKSTCHVMQTLAQQLVGKRYLVNCAECSNETFSADGLPCNIKLCGLTPPKRNNYECYVCDQPVVSASACRKTEFCTDTHVCSSSISIIGGNQLRYGFGCEERRVCAFSAQNNVKRTSAGITICSACCYGDQCNARDCFYIRKHMTVAGLGTNPPPPAG